MKNKKSVFKITKYLFAFIISLTMIFPFLWMISTSLKYNSQVFTNPIQWIPNPINWENYKKVWTDVPFLRYYFNTSFVTVVATILQVLISALSAYAFAKLDFKGKNVVFMLYISTMMIPWHTIMIPQYIVMGKLGLNNSLWALICGQLANAFGIFMLRQFFLGIPDDLRAAAQIDGANEFVIFSKIILPQALPGVAALTIFSFIQIWNDYLAPLIYLNDKEKYTIQLGLTFFQSEHSMQYGVIMAGTVCALIPVLIVYAIFEKYITQGIVFTGMK